MDLPPGLDAAFRFPLAEAVLSRRSRRFGLGMAMDDGSLAYASSHDPVPLSDLEEALLVTLGTGTTGLALGDLPRDGLSWMHEWSGRSWPCSCNSHSTELFLANDRGLHMVRTPALAGEDAEGYAGLTRGEALERMLARFRERLVTLEQGRPDLPRGEPGLFRFNSWNVGRPGTTLFVPVTDTTVEYLTLLFIYFDEEHRFSVIDELAGGEACGLERWRAAGRLGDHVRLSLMDLELRVLTTLNVEQAFICQNMALALEALGLGGWQFTGFLPHHLLGGGPDHRGLGFRFVTPESTPRHVRTPAPVGRDGVMEGLCPPYVGSMEEAVQRFLVERAAPASGGDPSPYRDPTAVMRGRADPSAETIEIVTAFCTYVLETYGRFPAFIDPMFVRLVFQAHHLDTDFYDRHYAPGAYTAAHRDHFALWHPPG